MVNKKIFLLACFIIIALVHIETKSQYFSFNTSAFVNPPEISVSKNKIDEIIDYGKTFIGKPYRYRGVPGWRMDCSGFLSHIFWKYGYDIPRSVGGIAQNISQIEPDEIQKGDLLFFKGRNVKRARLRHVGLVIDVINDTIQMLHSCSRGIRIDKFPQIQYYKKRFVKAGRLPVVDVDYLFSTPENTADSNRTKDSIAIIGVGDIMLGSNYPSAQYLPPNDGKDVLSNVKDILQDAHVTFGNLEGVLLTGDAKAKTCKSPEYCYNFKSPDHYADYFKEAGFDILSLANNHVGDFGDTGKANTVKVLQQSGINFAGLTEYPYTIFEKDSVKYGFCAFAPNSGTVSINDTVSAKDIVTHLDSLCNIVIVSFHGGAEGPTHRNITKKNESYLGENRGNPYMFARAVINAGADVVLGHGPHVTRAIDLYKNRFIAYSLGNFATCGKFNLKGVNGLAPIIKVFVDLNGEFLSANIISTKQPAKTGPVIDKNNGALKEIIKLTAADIPHAPLIISKDGQVKKKHNRQMQVSDKN